MYLTNTVVTLASTILKTIIVLEYKVQRIQGMMDIFDVRRATNPERVFQI